MIFVSLTDLADLVETLTTSTNDDDTSMREINAAIWRHVGQPNHDRLDRDWDRHCPQYLTTWDAACSLILPGWRLVLAGMGSEWTAGLGSHGRMVGASAPSAPQAIVAAAVRSRID